MLKTCLPIPKALLRAAVLATALSAMAAPSLATAPSQASVLRLVKAMQVERTLAAVMSRLDKSILERTRQQELSEANKAIAETFAVKVATALREEVRIDEFLTRMAEVYAGLFSEEEVQGLIAFYESPVGQSLLSKTPQMSEASSKVAQEFLVRALPRVQALMHEMQNEMRLTTRPEKQP